MSLQQFKVLTFDVVGTLIDFERGMLDYLRAVAPQSSVSDDDFLAVYRKARSADKTAVAAATDLVLGYCRSRPKSASAISISDSRCGVSGARE